MVKNLEKTILVLILVVAAFTRFWRLGTPGNFYFDEVYHAFTAKEFLLGNRAAWDFFATPPTGVAFEWTHPPLAKELMAVGMFIFGLNPFGWRFAGASAGVGVVFLTYFVGKKLFNNRVGLIASALITFETLTFVQSRIGMNDIYFLFFILAAFYFLVSDKFLPSGIFFGLAAAAKWTSTYFLFIVAFYLIWKFFKEKIKFNLLIFITSYLLLPVLIYLGSYLPFFLQGRGWADFWHLQQQMYWYHTKLTASHPYQSAWFTWPLDLRPVYYYLADIGGKFAKIYAVGNPAIFWGGLVVLWFSIVTIFQKLNFKILLLLFSYFAFFLPWAASPRIMFLYHYLPSLPFLILLIAVNLDKVWNYKFGKILTIGYMLVACGLFIYFYPHVAALPVTGGWDNQYYWISSWR